MGTVTVRHLDDEVRRRLRIRAATNNRSMEAEIRHILTTIVAPDEGSPVPPAEPPPAVAEEPLVSARHTASGQVTEPLTPRECAVAELIASGCSNREIAAALYLSERTVETHVGSILRKLGLRSRVAVALRYAARGQSG